MVMFTCNRCSAGLKKSQVETHAFKCGGLSRIDLTCHDCLKDFRGKEYESHTSCVTEQARYGGKGVVVKEAGKKQNQWCEVVQNVLANNKALDPDVYKFLKAAVLLPNIPRKKPAFVNWCSNCVKWAKRDLVDRVFDILVAEFMRTNSPEKLKTQNGSAKKDRSDKNSAQGGNEIADEGGAGKDGANHSEDNENGALGESLRKKKKDKIRKSHEITEGIDETMKSGDGEPTSEPSLNGEGEISESGQVPKKKKKNNKKSMEVTEEIARSVVDDSTRNDKKKKKSADISISEEPMEVEESLVMPNDEAEVGAVETENQPQTQKLSKKERKLLKKKAKFEAEVAEVQNFKKAQEENVVTEEEKPKKRKKRKNDGEEETDGQKDDGAKKRKIIAEQPETEDPQEEEKGSQEKVKFNWHETILTVLRKSKNDEVPVKKVTKRVIDEYLTQYGDKGIHEKLHAKMNKKLRTCPGVRVLKDKVKLLDGDR